METLPARGLVVRASAS